MAAVELDGVSLHYEISGPSTGPVILFVNSLGANLHMWDRVVPNLENDFRILRYDARGHGLSLVPALPYSIDHLGNDLLHLLDALSIECVNLCGLSLGGLVGMWLGIHAPQRARKLVLANTAAHIGTTEGWNARIAAVQSHGMTPIAQATLGRWFTPQYFEHHPEEMIQIRSMIEQTSPQGYIGCCGVLRDTDFSHDLARIGAPCLVIAGSEDPATPPADGRALHAGLRNSRYLELSASHLSAWEQSAEFACAMLESFHGKERGNG
jgi:3-oxoadipate enol-lactonase